MIINRLTMHNFGVYASTNTFEFTGRKPIVLIGGLNGRGKTTFLEAVLLSLYGANSFAYKESAFHTYGQYLRSYVNKNDGTLQTYVELEFQLNNEGRDRYIVRREWNAVNKKRTYEKIAVKKNGEPNDFLTENWPMFIENILPSALSNFFFFDGEKIAELAVDNTDTRLKESIRAMLGISVLDTLHSDLCKNVRKLKKNEKETTLTDHVNELRKNKQQAEEKLALIDSKISNLQNEINLIKEQIEQEKVEYTAKGGDIVDKREKFLADRARIEEKIEQNQEKMSTLAAGELPLSLVRDLLRNISKQGEKEQQAYVSKQATEKINVLFDEFVSNVDNNTAVQEFVDFVNRTSAASQVKEVYRLSDQTLYQIKYLVDTKIAATVNKAIEERHTQENLEKKADALDNYLSIEINEEELQQIYKKIRELEQKQADCEVEMESLTQARSGINGEVIKVNSEFNKEVAVMLNQMEASDDAERDLKYTEMAISVLDEYSVRLQRRKTDLLGRTITTCYKKLANKKNLIAKIDMDPVTLDLKYLDRAGKEVAKTALSAGEKQLMVISILWALAICSKKKLPVIIDTPLSRLDSNHRKALIQIYFPQASDQTIILSTDSEIDQKYYELMKDNVGDEFTLEYDDETKSTTIRKGYFVGDVA